MRCRAAIMLAGLALATACAGEKQPVQQLFSEISERSEALAPISCQPDEGGNGEVIACNGGQTELRSNCLNISNGNRNRAYLAQTFVAEKSGAPGRIRLPLRLLELNSPQDLAKLSVSIHPVIGGRVSDRIDFTIAAGSVSVADLPLNRDREVSVVLNSENDLIQGEPYALVVRLEKETLAKLSLACVQENEYPEGEVFRRHLRRHGLGDEDYAGAAFSAVTGVDLAFVVSVGDGCRGGVQTCGLGQCRVEVPVCIDGVPQECVPGEPSEEVCDGIDNNCDGIIDNLGDDEPELLFRSCYSGPDGSQGVGACRSGRQLCVAEAGSGVEAWGECEGEVLPGPEVCNGLDDDCDGFIDNTVFNEPERLQRECYTGAEGTLGVGVCRSGTQHCSAVLGSGIESWGGCEGQILPSAEICDGLDNDCDGEADNNLLSGEEGDSGIGDSCATGLPGICSQGIAECVAGEVVCQPVNEPRAEQCNGFDDNCDGFIDNVELGSPEKLTTECYHGDESTKGVGACRPGRAECIAEPGSGLELWAEEHCEGQVLPSPEVCDGIDNDCDGITDNDPEAEDEETKLSQHCYTGRPGSIFFDESQGEWVGVGVCRPGLAFCQGANEDGEPLWGDCEGEVTPSEEICDGLDNDCDGFTDNRARFEEASLVRSCYTGPENTLDAHGNPMGICERGSQTCGSDPVSGEAGWGECLGQILPQTEVCDALDNDCDGFTDNREFGDDAPLLRACYTGPEGTEDKGECRGGQQACEAGVWEVEGGVAVCVGEVLPMAYELCDGKDNTCNGMTDEVIEGFSPRDTEGNIAGESCVVPGKMGQCSIGVWTCTPQGMECISIYEPSPEICDGLDNDCDGEVDNIGGGNPEPIKEACYTGPKDTEGVGECKGGFRTCIAQTGSGVAAWGSCEGQVLPSAEVCDGLDNNCDGLVDAVAEEGYPEGKVLEKECYTGPNGTLGRGICRAGTQICQAEMGSGVAAWGGCEGQVLPSAEVCDGLDNDCDGLTDGDDPDLVLPLCSNQKGVCAGSRATAALCQNGVWLECGAAQYSQRSVEVHGADHYMPNDDVCDGFDNDCDGYVDNQNKGSSVKISQGCYTGPPETLGKGICKGGRKYCNAAPMSGIESFGECEGEVLPQTEICDGLDNDCDGLTDNASQDYVDLLTRECYSGPAYSLGPEGNPMGICRKGVETCVGGAWSDECVGEQLPMDEVCDGLDNDCDGFVDNYQFGTEELMRRECYTGPSETVEVGECKPGVQWCVGGIWETTNQLLDGPPLCRGEVTPSAEICDGLDNNCDGFTDNASEGEETPFLSRSCYTGPPGSETMGLCRPGVQTCIDGEFELGCPGEVTPVPEVCDNLDNDCDGYTDNAVRGEAPRLSEVCYTGPEDTAGVGVCREGLKECRNGIWDVDCPGEVVPSAEVCDGLDNDCDGEIDEDFGTTVCGHGPCQVVQLHCSGGDPQECEPDMSKASDEICDGIDNDCDGFVDNAALHLMCPPHSTVVSNSCLGIHGCMIDQCLEGTIDLDNVHSNGCECSEGVYASTCNAAQTQQPVTVYPGDGSELYLSRLPYSGESEWYVVEFPVETVPGAGHYVNGKAEIKISPDSGERFLFRVYTGNNCQSRTAASGNNGFGEGIYEPCWNETTRGITHWSAEDTCLRGAAPGDDEEEDCRGRKDTGLTGRTHAWPERVLVEVFRRNPQNDCNSTYRLTVSRSRPIDLSGP